MKDLPPIHIPNDVNYIAAFLSFSCQLRCTYCINHHGGNLLKARRMSGEDWIRGLNRIKTRDDLPITFQGGEPTVHKDFSHIVNSINKDTPLDVLTNFELPEAIYNTNPKRWRKCPKYASIRISYHHGQSDYEKLLNRTLEALNRQYPVGIWEVNCPWMTNDVKRRQTIAKRMGIDYRIKEFLGPWEGQIYGTIKYQESVNSKHLRNCMCATSELLIGPAGNIFRCHSDVYANRNPIGHILDPEFDGSRITEMRFCDYYGKCNSCDVKVTTNRFQEYGHTSVNIINVSEPTKPNDEYVTEIVNTYGKKDGAGGSQ